MPFLLSNVVFTLDKAGALVAYAGRHRKVQKASMGSISVSDAFTKAILALQEHDDWKDKYISGPIQIREYLDDPKSSGNIFRIVKVSVAMGNPPKQAQVRINETGSVVLVEDGTKFNAKGRAFTSYPNVAPDAVVDLPDLDQPKGVWPVWKITGPRFVSNTSKNPPARSHFGMFSTPPFEKDGWPEAHFAESHVYYHLELIRQRVIGWGATRLDKYGPMGFNPWVYPRWVDGGFVDTDNGWYTATDHSINLHVQPRPQAPTSGARPLVPVPRVRARRAANDQPALRQHLGRRREQRGRRRR